MLSYLPLVPVLLLLFTALAIFMIRLARPGFAYFWLLAATSTLLAWPATLILRRVLPLTISLGSWPAEVFSAATALLVDSISWPYALALSTLVLAVILTDVARYVEVNWVAWAGSLALAAIGILAVFSANPLTLLLYWGAIDLAELYLLLNQVEGSLARERVVISFSARVFGILLLLAGILAAKGSGVPLTFERIPRTASVYLLLASILRLGVVPLHLPILHDPRQRRGLGTMSRLVPAAASLVLLARIAVSGVSANLEALFLGISGATALYAGFSWLIAPDELEGRPYWMLGMASLSLAATVRGQPGASQAWGIAMLLSGALLFLFSARTRSLLILPLLSFFACLPSRSPLPGLE
jgi:hypothetical protein